MPSDELHPRSLKQPLTFGQRYGFALAGGFVIFVLTGALVLGWMAFFQQRANRVLSRSVGLTNTEQTESGSDTKRGNEFGQLGFTPLHAPGDERHSRDASSWKSLAVGGDEQRAAKEVLASFWNASTWRDKLSYVRHADRVAPLMQDFYEVRRQPEPRAGAFVSATSYQAGALKIHHLVYESVELRRPLEIAVIQGADGAMKLDWESYTGTGEMSWEAFRAQRPVTPVLLRAYAVLDDYFNFEFADANRYVCLKLVSGDYEGVLYAYAEKSGDLGWFIADRMPADSLQPVTVRVAFPEHAQSTNCVRLVEIVADRWLLLEE